MSSADDFDPFKHISSPEFVLLSDPDLDAPSALLSLTTQLQSLAVEETPPPPPPPLTFTLLPSTTDPTSLSNWWNDPHFGPLADDHPHSWLRAFPLLQSVTFACDGCVAITQKDGSCESEQQAACAKRHIEKVTQKLQYLRCDTCGSPVASNSNACCEKRTTCSLRTTFRISGASVDNVFGQAWSSASEEDGLQWLAAHEIGTKDKNGRSVLPVLLQRSAEARVVEQQVLQMLSSMDATSARLMTQGCFRSRPYSLMATTFTRKKATDFLSRIDLSLSSTCSEEAPKPHSQFGKIIDKQLKWGVKHGARDGSLPPGWGDAPASFGSLPYPYFQDIQICQETDALCKQHVVEFKTLECVHVDDASDNPFRRKKRADSLSEHVRQMAVSQTVLRETHAGSFLVMVGRDHRVLVLEDEGRRDRLGLPTAFAWLKNAWDYWFAPSQLHAAFLKQLVAVIAPYSQACALRKQLWDSDDEVDMSDWQCLFEMIAPHHARLLEMKTLADAEADRRRSSPSSPSHIYHASAGIAPRQVNVAAACVVAAHAPTACAVRVCKNWQSRGWCRHGDRCYNKDGHH
jgi:hypothetical protein